MAVAPYFEASVNQALLDATGKLKVTVTCKHCGVSATGTRVVTEKDKDAVRKVIEEKTENTAGSLAARHEPGCPVIAPKPPPKPAKKVTG